MTCKDAIAILRKGPIVEFTTVTFPEGLWLTDFARILHSKTGLSQGEVASLLALPAVLWRQLPFTGTAAQVPKNAGRIRFDRSTFIAKCHAIGLRVDFWTIDDPAKARALFATGADGVMTDDPRTICAADRACSSQ